MSSNSLALSTTVIIPPPKEKKGESNKSTSDFKKNLKSYRGILLALGSSFLYALVTVLAKLLTQHYHPFVIGAWLFEGLFFPTFIIMLYCWRVNKTPVFQEVTPVFSKQGARMVLLLVLRWFFGCSSLCFQYLAMQYINLADSMVIAFSSPVFVTIVAHKYLGEKCGVVPIVAGIITILGMIVVTRPPLLTGKDGFDKDTLIGIGFALACMICLGLSFILIRRLRQVHFSFIVSFFGLWGIGECFLLAILFGAKPDGFIPHGLKHWGLFVIIATCGFMSQMGLVLSLKFEQATVVSMLRTLDVIFTIIWQLIILRVIPDLISAVGCTIMVSGVLLVGFRKWLYQLPPDHPAVQKFWFLLK